MPAFDELFGAIPLCDQLEGKWKSDRGATCTLTASEDGAVGGTLQMPGKSVDGPYPVVGTWQHGVNDHRIGMVTFSVLWNNTTTRPGDGKPIGRTCSTWSGHVTMAHGGSVIDVVWMMISESIDGVRGDTFTETDYFRKQW